MRAGQAAFGKTIGGRGPGSPARFRQGLNQVAKFFDVEAIGDAAVEPRPGREFRSLIRGVLQDHRDSLRGEGPSTLSSAEPERDSEAWIVLPELTSALEGLMVSRNDLLRMFRESAPLGWGPPPGDRTSIALLSGCVHSLARAPRQGGNGQFPLLRFVQLLADQLEGEEALALRAWLDHARARLGQGVELPPARTAGRAAEAAAAASVQYLLVQVSPRLCEANHFPVCAPGCSERASRPAFARVKRR